MMQQPADFQQLQQGYQDVEQHTGEMMEEEEGQVS